MNRPLAYSMLLAVAASCSSTEPSREVPAVHAAAAPVATFSAAIPRGTAAHFPSMVAIKAVAHDSEVSTGTMLSDVDSCAMCHPDVAAQWSASAHSFASFGNPSYRANVERVRADLGLTASNHCGGCHDMPLMVDGMMASGEAIPPDDLRSHSGVTCRLCHGIESTTHDGNGSYVWNPTSIDAPDLADAASVSRHKQQVTTKLGAELCVGCHRGFLSPDMNLPVHLTGVDEPGMWRNSAYSGNGLARIDAVEQKNCLDCHMEREQVSKHELGAKKGSVKSHRFVGGHTWMAAMRGDSEQLRLTRAKLEGVASIDVAGARLVDAKGVEGPWHLPAETAPVVPGSRLELDVVIRNLLVGHRFPGGLLDVQDTWIEVDVTDRAGVRIASSGLAHERDPKDQDTHVLKTLVVDEHGTVLEEHEVAKFRTQVATHTLAPREAQAVRYALSVPANLTRARHPLTVTARLRHRSRSLGMQQAACISARTAEGKAFIDGARGARDVTLDPCAPQPVTLIAQTKIELGTGARTTTSRPTWQRTYEHGMALVASVITRLDEARAVLEVALAAAPDARSRAMVIVELGWVAAKQGRAEDALALVSEARKLWATTIEPGTPVKDPPVLDAIVADAFVRLHRWNEAAAPAKACTERAPSNTAAWAVYARVLTAIGDYSGALAAAARGLELSPRDPDLLRSQATSLAGLRDPKVRAAQDAYTRFRTPDEAPSLRIKCAKQSERCMRDRNSVHIVPLRAASR